MKLDLQYTGIADQLVDWEEKASEAFQTLVNKSGEGNDFLGWIDQPENYDKEEYDRIKKAAEKIRSDSEVLVVIGIGGSYLGARAVIEALSPRYKKGKTEILYAGNHLSAPELKELMDYIQDKDFSINVISKSGTTTEPAIAFRLLKEQLEDKVGEDEAVSRIYVTTDQEKGALKTLADEVGYETFVVPDDIGGRFTVLTAVGLLPIAAAGLDIDALMEGARDAMRDCLVDDLNDNPAMQYAAARNYLYENGKAIEIMVTYEPKLSYVQEWWKQLYGESEGKDGKGIYPASVVNTTDLHSMGQWVQDGERIIFETIITVHKPSEDITLKEADNDLDGLNYLAGKTLHEVNQKAMEGTRQAHISGGVPNIMINLEKLDEYNLGQLLYFFEVGVGVSGYMLGVNPFNQPGVELYKSNMFKLLGKPGYTED